MGADRRRHLAIFLRSLLGGGGAERMMVALAGALQDRGHRVDLVLARAAGNFFDEIHPDVRIVDLRVRTVLPALSALLRHPAEGLRMLPALLPPKPRRVLGAIPALERYLRQERPDAMLSALNYSNLAALWACRFAGVPTRLVVSERNTLSVRARRSRAQNLRALPAMIRRFYPWADAVTAVSDGVADDLARISGIPRAAITTTWNPVVSPALTAAAARPLEHPFFRPGEPPVVLGAGKLRPQKDFGTLLDAFAKLRSKRSARLVILGEGPDAGALRVRARRLGISADVSFEGFVPNPFAYMARAGAFALCSAWEGLPAVLIQAMACGCPVASTDCPSGPAEILEDGAHGPLVPVGDSDALAAAILRLLGEPPDRDRLRRRAQDFSVDRVAERYLGVLLPGAAARGGR
jgi:glycosyltransferase involved in cell wall biosynthesis